MLNQPDAGVGQSEEEQVEGLRALVQAFEDGSGEGVAKGEGKRKGECHFLASVFANVSTVSTELRAYQMQSNMHSCWLKLQLPSTRSLLLTPYPPFPQPSTSAPETPETTSDTALEYEPLLSKLTPYTTHPDTIRRGGCLGAIKNIALDRGCHAFLLAGEGDRVRMTATGAVAASSSDETSNGGSELVRGVDVLPSVLGPLMGGEEYDMDVSYLPTSYDHVVYAG